MLLSNVIRSRKWSGKIVVFPGQNTLKVHAVIAPPTSQMLFQQYQKHGDTTKHYIPIKEIPEEYRSKTLILLHTDLPEIQ